MAAPTSYFYLESKDGQKWSMTDHTGFFTKTQNLQMWFKSVFISAVNKCGSEDKIKTLQRINNEDGIVLESYYLEGVCLKELK